MVENLFHITIEYIWLKNRNHWKYRRMLLFKPTLWGDPGDLLEQVLRAAGLRSEDDDWLFQDMNVCLAWKLFSHVQWHIPFTFVLDIKILLIRNRQKTGYITSDLRNKIHESSNDWKLKTYKDVSKDFPSFCTFNKGLNNAKICNVCSRQFFCDLCMCSSRNSYYTRIC